MRRITLVKDGILYRNPRPGYQAECAFLPYVLPLSPQELLCFCSIGQAFYSVDGKLLQLRSVDGGYTWQREGLVWDPVGDDTPCTYNSTFCTELVDGTLLLTAQRRDVSGPDNRMYNPETEGQVPVQWVLCRSTDRGRTWSAPKALDLPGDGAGALAAPIIELAGGRLFLPCEMWKAWDDPSPLHIKGFALFSDDGGTTWADRLDYPSAGDKSKMYSHSRYTKMSDGRLLALQWTQSHGMTENYDLHLTMGDRTATQWSYPRPTGIRGQTSWAVDLGDGVLAAIYSLREGERPGVMIILSEDEGASWDMDGQFRVWDALGRDVLGPDRSRHENIAFGAPHVARLSDDRIICSWWCTQACLTLCRFSILHIE